MLKDKLNSILENHYQESRITSILANKNISMNNIVYLDNDAITLIRRIRRNDLWADNIDNIYIHNMADVILKIKSIKSSSGGIACQEKHGEKIRKNLNTGIPWNKELKGNYPHTPWSKGLTKSDNASLLKLSNDRLNEGNPFFGKTHSLISKEQQSMSLRAKILSGEFTPNSNNRNTHWTSYFDNKKFRSSWEAIYFSLHQTELYESLRIEYIYECKPHIYIVDFVNHHTKVATEIKPAELLGNKRESLKLLALEEWCSNNGYVTKIITQDDIEQMSTQVDPGKFDNNTQRKIRKLHETYIKNRNR